MRDREELIGDIEAYRPFNEQELRDRELILRELRENGGVFERSSAAAHMTASAWITDRARRRVLMAFHNIYKSWSWLGGHADGETDLLAAALREAREESGLESVRAVSGRIFSLESLTVDGHEKRGEYVSSHLHLNVTYLLEADASEPPRCKTDENSGVRWFSLDDAIAASSEPWFRERIYSKLNAKLALL